MSVKSVLIVDNSDTLGTREFLARHGFQVLNATNPQEGRRRLEEGAVDLAVIDLRLVDEDDESDFSGLELARTCAPAVPKIIWTKFPSYEIARDALGPVMDGLPAAVGFVGKQEGPRALLRTIRVALARPNLVVERALLASLGERAMVRIPARVRDVGEEAASRALRQTLDDSGTELREIRDREGRRETHHHWCAMAAAVVALSVVLTGVILLYWGLVAPGTISLVGSTVPGLVSRLFFKREDVAHQRAIASRVELNRVASLEPVFGLIENLQKSEDRDEYRKKIIDFFLDKWLVT